MDKLIRPLASVAVVLSVGAVEAADLVIARSGGRCDYQIAVPDQSSHPAIGAALDAAAEVLREMFKANGWTVPVVKEAKAAPGQPAMYLGDTRAARAAGMDPTRMPIWGYACKAVGRNIVIAGRDWPAPAKARGKTACSQGTVKGLTDFMVRFCGTRFLTPGGLTGIEFLPIETIVVPADLLLRKEPMVAFNSRPGSQYTADAAAVALNLLDNVSDEYSGHTHEKAVPAEKYAETHPEYFALYEGKRVHTRKRGGRAEVYEKHLCYSNKEVQDLIYGEMLRSFDAGYTEYRSVQADGFTPCQCDACKRLFNTDDWGEKLWLLNRMWAQRLLRDRPGKCLAVGSYTVTERPPESFRSFPPNMRADIRGAPRTYARWEGYDVPAGFTCYLHGWGGYHLCGYLPVRTPLYAEQTVKDFALHRIKGVHLDMPANLWGLEGPTAYVYGRMFDDPESLTARELVQEYIHAAYGKAANAMERFFEELHHTLEAYTRVFGVDGGLFTGYEPIGGRRRRYLTSADKLRLIGFLYPPETLDLLESHLAQAERTAGLGPKHTTRLALTRRDFNYLKSTARVVHLYNAYLTRKHGVTLDQLLNEMEARETMIRSWYDTRGEKPRQKPIAPDWPLYVGGAGHSISHLTRNGGGYLATPVPPFTWDIEKMRRAPVLAPKILTAGPIRAPWPPAAREWAAVPGAELGPSALGATAPTQASTVKVAYDRRALHIRFEGRLPGGWVKPTGARADSRDNVARECFDAVLAPNSNPARYFRFAGGPDPAARYDARHGFIEDSIDPRFDDDDVEWNCAWEYAAEIAADGKNWCALMSIPFRSLGAAAPAPGIEWKANFGRVHEYRPNDKRSREESLWSANPQTTSIGDRAAFSTLRFE
ncbi:MAG: DUF4838 domain-containing protein [Kiritimatiellae bacterium]|nr:DUF4838 domain-containing protein [Kiritimatiellia bacterium]